VEQLHFICGYLIKMILMVMRKLFYYAAIFIGMGGCSSAGKKKIIITGFIRTTDKLVVRYSNSVNTDWDPDCSRDTTQVCFINETLKCPSAFCLLLQVDSAGSIIFDTGIVIPKENREPVVSIENPLENGKRRVFVIDNSQFKKY
jgi:hypothetical protein